MQDNQMAQSQTYVFLSQIPHSCRCRRCMTSYPACLVASLQADFSLADSSSQGAPETQETTQEPAAPNNPRSCPQRKVSELPHAGHADHGPMLCGAVTTRAQTPDVRYVRRGRRNTTLSSVWFSASRCVIEVSTRCLDLE